MIKINNYNKHLIQKLNKDLEIKLNLKLFAKKYNKILVI